MTTIATRQFAFPFASTFAVVQAKADWNDGWRTIPNVRPVSAEATAGAAGLGSLEMVYRYGYVKQPWESGFVERGTIDLLGYWVRLRVISGAVDEVIWTGRVSTESTRIFGDSQVPSGVQTFVAYEPQHLLQKISIGKSYFADASDNPISIGWIPTFNSRDRRNILVGNRNSTPTTGDRASYLFGGDQVWSRLDMIRYILNRFVNTDSGDDPVWTIGGLTDGLAASTDSVTIPESTTVAGALETLINPALALDYRIVTTKKGFEVRVYGLNDQTVSFGSTTIEADADRITVVLGSALDVIEARVERTIDHQRASIRVIGDRIVSCFSVSVEDGTLQKGWTDEKEAKYKVPSQAMIFGDYEVLDQVRGSPFFEEVYQRFYLPDDWDYNGEQANPKFDLNGERVEDQNGVRQSHERSLLGWVPMYEGFDYRKSPPEDGNPPDVNPDLLPPSGWYRWYPMDKTGVSLAMGATDWTIYAHANPNHLAARDDVGIGVVFTLIDSKYRWQDMTLTLATQLDQRLELGLDLVENPSPMDGSITIVVPEAQLWFLAPKTRVNLDADPNNDKAFNVDSVGLADSGQEGRVLRNDAPRLERIVAGAIARYRSPRNRAMVSFKGIKPWPSILGQFLDVRGHNADPGNEILSPVTSVVWRFEGNPSTTIRSGYAR